MDGDFVKTNTSELFDLKKITSYSKKKLDIHLMVKKPNEIIDLYCFPTTEIISIHYESECDFNQTFNKLKENNLSYKESIAMESLNQLNSDQEIEIQQLLSQFPDVINRSADNYEPHLICYYLRNLAGAFHSYYNKEKILVEQENSLQAKLFLISAVRQVVFNGLKVLGISAPKSM